MENKSELQVEADQSDVRLLQNFVRHRDADAFATIVRRYGPMVWSVCRRILHQQQDAEDAFQATFLVLVYKARSIAQPQLLGNWLYRVAYRTARKARAVAIRQENRDKATTTTATREPPDEVMWKDLRPVLDDEVHRLPRKYRAAVVLCYLEGKTAAEAAQLLGCPRATVLTHLARARERLRKRLTKRGLTLSSAVLASLLKQGASAERAQAAATLDARQGYEALRLRPDGTLGNVSAKATQLARRVVHAMRATSLSFVVVLLLVNLLAMSAIGWTVFHSLTRQVATPHWARPLVRLSREALDEVGGQWTVTRIQRNGRDQTQDANGYVTLDIQAEGFTARGERRAVNLPLAPLQQLFPSAKDLNLPAEALDSLNEIAVYDVEGDTLKILAREHLLGAVPGPNYRDCAILELTAKRVAVQ